MVMNKQTAIIEIRDAIKLYNPNDTESVNNLIETYWNNREILFSEEDIRYNTYGLIIENFRLLDSYDNLSEYEDYILKFIIFDSFSSSRINKTTYLLSFFRTSINNHTHNKISETNKIIRKIIKDADLYKKENFVCNDKRIHKEILDNFDKYNQEFKKVSLL